MHTPACEHLDPNRSSACNPLSEPRPEDVRCRLRKGVGRGAASRLPSSIPLLGSLENEVAPGGTTLGTEEARVHWPSIFNRSAPEVIMYHHVKKLMYTVRVDEP